MRDMEPSDGEARTLTWYAWLPVTVGRETRWLEYVTAHQMYGMNPGEWGFGRGWISVAFVDDQDDFS